MTTLRVAKRRRFVQMDTRTVNDGRLSFRARGVLAWLLDKPDDWQADSTSIARHGREGRDAVRAALSELADCGYLLRVKEQGHDGKWRTITVVYENPQDNPQAVDNGATGDGKPGVGQPGVGFPGAITKTHTQTQTSTASDSGKRNPTPPTAGEEEKPAALVIVAGDLAADRAYRQRCATIGPPTAPRRWRKAVAREWVADFGAAARLTIAYGLDHDNPVTDAAVLMALAEAGTVQSAQMTNPWAHGCDDCGHSGWHDTGDGTVTRCADWHQAGAA